MGKKQAELMNTGHIMDDDTFITHLLNSLPQTEYEGAILIIKDKLRKGTVEIPEIEQVLEDKNIAMKHAKGWEEEEDDYALFASPSNKKGPKKAFKGRCGYCGEFGHKAADCPNKKSNQNKGQKSKIHQKKKQHGKGDSKGKRHLDISKIKCFNCGKYGDFARDCPKARDNANIAQESEQKGKSESMLDLDSTSVSEECAMVCTELQYEDASKNEVVYGDQGISIEEYEKATYDDVMKTQSKEEDKVKCTVVQRANDSVILERNEIVYEITVQNCTMKKTRTKKPVARNRLIEEPSQNNLNHVFEMYEESGSDVDPLEDFLKGESKKNSKEDNYTSMDEEKEGKQADLLRSKITQYDHDIPRKKRENEKALVMKEVELSHLGKNIFICDSAATSHMTSNKMGVYDLVPIKGSVMIGNGESISCTQKGKLDVICKHKDGSIAREAWDGKIVPELNHDLFSFTKAMKDGWQMNGSGKRED